MNSEELSNEITGILSAKKAGGILKIDVREKSTLADYFIIASGRASVHVKALCENVEDALSKKGIEPLRKEGIREGRWSVLDYGEVILHVFNDENRDFYNLERLWDEGNNVTKID